MLQVSSEQADLEMRYAEAEAQLSRMQTILAEHEQLKIEKRRLLDDLQVPSSEKSPNARSDGILSALIPTHPHTHRNLICQLAWFAAHVAAKRL
jgi:hypothetical protein